MTEQAQGIAKQLIIKKQDDKVTVASGSGGQLIRRETASFTFKKDTFSPNEMNSHRMHVGDSYGAGAAAGTINGVLSPGTYAAFFANVLRQDFAAKSSLTGLSLTVAASGLNWTITRGSGSWITDGVKVTQVARLTAGAFNALNLNKNLVILNVTATVLTVATLNGSALEAEGPITGATLAFPGKLSKGAATAHTNDYYTVEERNTDAGKSRIYEAMQTGKIDVNGAANGNVGITIAMQGLGRSKSDSQVLTTPTDETSTPVLNTTNGVIIVGTEKQLVATGCSFSIDLRMNAGEAVVGSKRRTDNVKNDLIVTGSLTLLFEDEDEAENFDNETPVPIIMVAADTQAADSDFVAFGILVAKLQGDDLDDGKKQLVMSMPFTAGIQGTGGSSSKWDKTVITVQDSQAA